MKRKVTYKYSPISLAIRLIVSLILIVAATLVVVYREAISSRIYNWSEDDKAPADFSVHYIDVGQGDSSLIEFDDGTNMLIDCGPRSSGDDLVEYISGLGITTINHFLLTHPDEDHIGGGVKIFENFQVNNFYRPMFRSNSESEPSNYPKQTTLVYDNVIISAKAEPNCEIHYSSDEIFFAGVNYSIDFLYPTSVIDSTNQSSAIVLATLDGVNFLFTGDAEKKQENEAIAKYSLDYGKNLKVDVLKAGHHGAKTASDDNFVGFISPSYAVISCGKNNKYKHPDEETLATFEKYEVRVMRTDLLGDITLEVKSGVLYVDGKGKMIDYVLISSIIFVVVMVIWAIPDGKKGAREKKDVKK